MDHTSSRLKSSLERKSFIVGEARLTALQESHSRGQWECGSWPRWCSDGLWSGGQQSIRCRRKEMETSRPADSLENLRGRCNRGSVGEARSPSGGKSFFSHVLLLFSVSFMLEVHMLIV